MSLEQGENPFTSDVLPEKSENERYMEQLIAEVLESLGGEIFGEYVNKFRKIKEWRPEFILYQEMEQPKRGSVLNVPTAKAVGFVLYRPEGKSYDSMELKFGRVTQLQLGEVDWQRYATRRRSYPYTVCPPESMQPANEAVFAWRFPRGNIEEAKRVLVLGAGELRRKIDEKDSFNLW